MKKIKYILVLSLAIFLLSSCTESKKADIVTTMFPQYDFASKIVGDKMTVSLLTPPGVEPHSFHASSKDLVAIKESKLFIFTSLDIDTWITHPDEIGGNNTIVMNLSEHYVLEEHDHTHTLSYQISDDHDHSAELHYWVDPMIALQLIDAILDKIILIDPNNETYYRENARLYHDQIHDLHVSFDNYIQNGHVNSTVYFAGHNALGLFGERYHINIHSLFESFKPDADLTSDELDRFIAIIGESNIAYLFIEELIEPKAALTIKNELQSRGYHIDILELHGYHNVTKDEMSSGVSYFSLFQRNIDYIQLALGESHD